MEHLTESAALAAAFYKKLPVSCGLTKSFTLVELIIVIIVVGILAALGLSQYEQVVEKSRIAEAKLKIEMMRSLAYQYYLENGDFSTITNADVGVDSTTCNSKNYFYYALGSVTASSIGLASWRCTSGGKSPNTKRQYIFLMRYYPATGQSSWSCRYADDSTSCFGFPVL